MSDIVLRPKLPECRLNLLQLTCSEKILFRLILCVSGYGVAVGFRFIPTKTTRSVVYNDINDRFESSVS